MYTIQYKVTFKVPVVKIVSTILHLVAFSFHIARIRIRIKSKSCKQNIRIVNDALQFILYCLVFT